MKKRLPREPSKVFHTDGLLRMEEGSTQSPLEAMKELGNSMKQINWNQWAVARFLTTGVAPKNLATSDPGITRNILQASVSPEIT